MQLLYEVTNEVCGVRRVKCERVRGDGWTSWVVGRCTCRCKRVWSTLRLGILASVCRYLVEQNLRIAHFR